MIDTTPGYGSGVESLAMRFHSLALESESPARRVKSLELEDESPEIGLESLEISFQSLALESESPAIGVKSPVLEGKSLAMSQSLEIEAKIRENEAKLPYFNAI
ncbi:MAG: hypothetical protein LBD93_10550 [Treponema sp.]|jgi:hypothetical protein|nr:hypothetical protein [Treponema sp.]